MATRRVYAAALTVESAAAPMAPAPQRGRMDVPVEVDREFNDWYNTVYVKTVELA